MNSTLFKCMRREAAHERRKPDGVLCQGIEPRNVSEYGPAKATARQPEKSFWNIQNAVASEPL